MPAVAPTNPSNAPQAMPPVMGVAEDAPHQRRLLPVLGAPIDVVSAQEAVHRISAWAQRHESRVVCICNAHSVVTAAQEASFMHVLTDADLATPDGAPVAWMLRRQGAQGQTRVSGPDLMIDYMAHAAAQGESVFLLGSTPGTLDILQTQLRGRWPALRIAGALSPPFRTPTAEEADATVQQINASGAGTVWVSLGCPKQEQWMYAHRGKVQAVMVGVGAAFDFHAGTVKRAPAWMQNNGIEWLHRFVSEPRRLWRRYLVTNSRFVWGAALQLLRSR
jgi:N-acetylglucosaminyldiphosphoundecaprenol N-acetyl-beta-D-mannosaminyltransferase